MIGANRRVCWVACVVMVYALVATAATVTAPLTASPIPRGGFPLHALTSGGSPAFLHATWAQVSSPSILTIPFAANTSNTVVVGFSDDSSGLSVNITDSSSPTTQDYNNNRATCGEVGAFVGIAWRVLPVPITSVSLQVSLPVFVQASVAEYAGLGSMLFEKCHNPDNLYTSFSNALTNRTSGTVVTWWGTEGTAFNFGVDNGTIRVNTGATTPDNYQFILSDFASTSSPTMATNLSWATARRPAAASVYFTTLPVFGSGGGGGRGGNPGGGGALPPPPPCSPAWYCFFNVTVPQFISTAIPQVCNLWTLILLALAIAGASWVVRSARRGPGPAPPGKAS